jgi:hypothetical protein
MARGRRTVRGNSSGKVREERKKDINPSPTQEAQAPFLYSN